MDHEAQELLNKLKTKSIPKEVDENNTERFDIRWSNNSGINKWDHQQYLLSLCDSFYNLIKKNIVETLRESCHSNPLKEEQEKQTSEILQHLSMCESRCQMFQVCIKILFVIHRDLWKYRQIRLALGGCPEKMDKKFDIRRTFHNVWREFQMSDEGL